MRCLRILLWLIGAAAGVATPSSAASINGIWMGAFTLEQRQTFVQVRFGGSGETLAGRMDLPLLGQQSILLKAITFANDRVRFTLPNAGGDVTFEATVKSGDHFSGSVRHGGYAGSFELHLMRPLSPIESRDLVGDYAGAGPEDVVLLYESQGNIHYVEYASGRFGRLYALADGRLVSGPNLMAGFPVELAVTQERDANGRTVAVTWQRKGEPSRTLRHRVFYRVQHTRLASSDGTVLVGSVLVPRGPGPFAAVVLIPGSGAVTGDMLMPFADGFARRGIAVFVNDKRGVGDSGGDSSRTSIDDLAEDALAAVAWLKRHPAIDPNQIGLAGASLGGWVAPLAAARSRDVRFLILEAAPAVTPAEHERARVEHQMRADGLSTVAIAHAMAYMDRKFAVARSGRGWEALQRMAGQARLEQWQGYVNPPVSLESLRWNWDHVLSYDPLPALRALRIPVLALFGERDRVVPVDLNRGRLEHALREAKNPDVTVKVLTGANHNFLTATTGGATEVPHLRAFAADYFVTRNTWLLQHVVATTPLVAEISQEDESATYPGVRGDGATDSDADSRPGVM